MLLMQVIEEVVVNTRVFHLEGNTIFGSTKRKLNLCLAKDDSNSHHQDCEFYYSKIWKGNVTCPVFEHYRSF